jgi:hypothetical protein
MRLRVEAIREARFARDWANGLQGNFQRNLPGGLASTLVTQNVADVSHTGVRLLNRFTIS